MTFGASGIDDLIRRMQLDELEDKATTTTHLTPIEYARARGMAPQRVYYAIRNHKLETEYCQCGRKVISIEKADAHFKIAKEVDDSDTSGTTSEAVPGADDGEA